VSTIHSQLKNKSAIPFENILRRILVAGPSNCQPPGLFHSKTYVWISNLCRRQNYQRNGAKIMAFAMLQVHAEWLRVVRFQNTALPLLKLELRSDRGVSLQKGCI
jgi:hypothetical protein